MPFPKFILLIFSLLTIANPATAQQKKQVINYLITLNGKVMGHSQNYFVILKNKNIASHSLAQMSIKRAGSTLHMTTHTIYEESPDFKTVSLTHTQWQSIPGQPQLKNKTSKRLIFSDDHVTLSVTSADQKTTHQRLPLPVVKQIITPMRMLILFHQALLQGKKQLQYTALSPETGLTPMTLTTHFLGKTTLPLEGKKRGVYKSISENSLTPTLRITSHTDSYGTPVRLDIPVGPFKMRYTQTTQPIPPITPAEVFIPTLIKPTGILKSPAQSVGATYILTLKKTLKTPGGTPKKTSLHFPRAASQTPIWANQRTLVLHIDTTRSVTPKDDLPTAKHRESSHMIAWKNKHVLQLHQRALREKIFLNHRGTAIKLKKFVYKSIAKKDFNSANATASQVAVNLSGDCTEHAVLLTALLRASKIPSRTVIGLVAVSGSDLNKPSFGFHMWTQAWIDDDPIGGRWIDLDATRLGRFDASHIALGTSDQSDRRGAIHDTLQILPFLTGSVKIHIKNVTYK